MFAEASSASPPTFIIPVDGPAIVFTGTAFPLAPAANSTIVAGGPVGG